MEKDCCDTNKTSGRNILSVAGAGCGFGLAALGGACVTGCSLVAGSIATFLGSIGLGAIATILPALRVPLLLGAAVLGVLALRGFIKQRDALKAAVTGMVLGSGLLFAAWQALAPKSCQDKGAMANVMHRLTPETREILRKGVYGLWPALGRAPTLTEIQQKMGFADDSKVLKAFDEIEQLGMGDAFYPGTRQIRWAWPFSNEDHGVTVVLNGSKPVHARCAIDALGMSTMFRRPAKITVVTPLDRKSLEFEIDGDRVISADPLAVVSYRPNDCDSMLFFSSMDELKRYQAKSGKQLVVFPLAQALKAGIGSFGGILET
jgi:hypothetical protein